MRFLAWVLVGILLVMVVRGWVVGQARTQAAMAEADEMAAALLARRAEADGWRVRLATETRRLVEELAASDSQGARLARELTAARMRLSVRTVAVVSATDTAHLEGAPLPPAARADGVRCTDAAGNYLACLIPGDTVGGVLEQGPLRGRWLFVAPSALVLAWSFEFRGEFHHAVAPDGRLMVFARSTDPRVRLEIPVLKWDPPRVRRTRLEAYARAAAAVPWIDDEARPAMFARAGLRYVPWGADVAMNQDGQLEVGLERKVRVF